MAVEENFVRQNWAVGGAVMYELYDLAVTFYFLQIFNTAD